MCSAENVITAGRASSFASVRVAAKLFKPHAFLYKQRKTIIKYNNETLIFHNRHRDFCDRLGQQNQKGAGESTLCEIIFILLYIDLIAN